MEMNIWIIVSRINMIIGDKLIIYRGRKQGVMEKG